MIVTFEGKCSIFLVIVFIFTAGAIPLGTSGKEVMVDLIDRGIAYLGDGVVETWCEVMNYGGRGLAVIEAWVSLPDGQETRRYEKTRTITLDRLTGDILLFRFNTTAFCDCQFGFLILNQTNLDDPTTKGGWSNGVLALIVMVLFFGIFIGLKMYIKWARFVTDFVKERKSVTHFKPDSKEN